jgi:hypothetical protein
MIRLVCRAAFAALMAAIIVLSLVPPLWRPVTPAPHGIEHLLIFAAAGLTMAAALPWRWWSQATALLWFAVAVEIAQLFVPGRHARLSDLIVNMLGAWLGLALARLTIRFIPSVRQAADPALDRSLR